MKSEKIILSIITPTLNNQKDIKHFIESIKRQNFPKNKMEIVISDGGSVDETIKIAKKMGARVIKNPYVFAEPIVTGKHRDWETGKQVSSHDIVTGKLFPSHGVFPSHDIQALKPQEHL